MNGSVVASRSARPIVEITGFRPFLDVAINPSALLVASLQDDPSWIERTRMDARFTLLDTVYEGLRAQIAKLLASPPAALILTGYSRHATGLKIETRATSLCSPDHADASGRHPPATHEPMEEHANSGVDFPDLVERIRGEGLSCDLSDDAGEYVCNHSYFHALDLIAQRGLDTRTLFVHLPAIENMPEAPEGAGQMALTEMHRAMALIARALVVAKPAK